MNYKGIILNDEKESSNKQKIRILMVGPAATGKTAIVERFVNGIFMKDYVMTMGGEIYIKSLKINGNEIDLIINDLPGEDRFKLARESFYTGAAGALLVFDLTRYTTFNPGLFERLKELWEHAGKIPTIIIGNKKDLADQEHFRSVRKQDVLNYCNKIPCDYVETSACENIGINKAFNMLIKKIING